MKHFSVRTRGRIPGVERLFLTVYSLLGSWIDTVRVLSIHAVKSNKWVLLLLLNKVTVPAHVFNMDTCHDKGTEITKVS